MTARCMAGQLNRPLLVLNLAAIMSHELGHSANNPTAALDAAEHSNSVLFIDEFDAVASHRGNRNDVGEMRRLVNVLPLRLTFPMPLG
jgi:AAA+ superfamily predicted ATPase